MIVIKVELWSARTLQKTVLCSATISNIGGTLKRGEYKACIGNKHQGGDIRKVHNRPWRVGEVKAFPRNSYHVWRLVLRALRAAFPEEK